MFHNFPKVGDKIPILDDNGMTVVCDRRKLWENKLQITKDVSRFMKVCSRHFTAEDYEYSGIKAQSKTQGSKLNRGVYF